MSKTRKGMKMKNFLETLKKKAWCSELLLALPLFLLSLGILLYYIIGPSRGFFHSDCADSILWANATVESGKVFSEDFHYAALLPFGSSLWMVPAVAVFGLSMRAQIFSMSVFAILFVAVLAFFFRSMRWSWKWTAAAVFSASMILSGSEKLREIMWEHTIYYSLGILLMFLLLGLLFRVLSSPYEKGKRARFIVFSLLFLAVCIGCGTDSFQMIALTVVPVLGGLALYTFFDGETPLFSARNERKYYAAGLMVVGVLAGLLLLLIFTNFGEIYAGYENAYSNWSALSEWKTNAGKFFEQYFSLLGIEVVRSPIFSLASIATLVKLGGALLLLLLPLVLLCRYTKIQDKYTKIALLAHWVLTAVILFGYICGMLAAASWRLTPFVGSAVVTSFLCVRHLVGESGSGGKRIGILLVVILLAFSPVNAKTVASIPADTGADDPIYTVIDELEERGLDYGYASFWNAGKTTLLSDGKLLVRNITVDASGVTPYLYQTSDRWYEDIPGKEYYFLLLTADEYRTYQRSALASELEAEGRVLSASLTEGYYIVEVKGNPFSE